MAAAQPFSPCTRGWFRRPNSSNYSSSTLHMRGKQVVPCGKPWHGVGFVPGAVFREVESVCFLSQRCRYGISTKLEVCAKMPDNGKLDGTHSVAPIVVRCERPVAREVSVGSLINISNPAPSGSLSSSFSRCAQKGKGNWHGLDGACMSRTGIRVRVNVGRTGGRSSDSRNQDEPPELELQPILEPEAYEPPELELQPILEPEAYDLQEFAELDELEEFLDLELESDMYTETPRHYEIMFLIHEKNVDEVQIVIEKVRDFIRDNKGVIHRLNDWGMRSLAYPIKKASNANYVLMNIEIGSQAINDLNSLFQKDDRVIRHMVMSQKIAITADSVPPEEYLPSRIPVSDEEFDEADDDEYEDEEDEEEQPELLLQRE